MIKAAWKGDVESVLLIIEIGRKIGVDLIDSISIGVGNYGKSAIFYAITQDRIDVIRLLISKGATLCIVNNKGQTPCSMSVSRFDAEMQSFMLDTEQSQLESGVSFINYRASHSDERQYGDLDPRFLLDPDDVNYSLDATLEILEHKERYGEESLPRSVCVTTPDIRRARFKKDNQRKSHHLNQTPTTYESKTLKPITNSNVKGKQVTALPMYQGTLSLEKVKLLDLISTEAVIVDNEEKIDELIHAINKTEDQIRLHDHSSECDVRVVSSSWSLDAEWKPNGKGEDNPVAVLQLGTSNAVFIIDMLSLCRAQCHPNTTMIQKEISLSNALSRIFVNNEIRIVGFGVNSDLEKLAGSYPHIKAFHLFTSVIDLASISRVIYPKQPKGTINSLQKLCAFLLNKRLDKTEQCSPWHLRPLSDDQIEYAALDALIAIALLNEMIIKDDTNDKFDGSFFNKNKQELYSFRFTLIPDAPVNFSVARKYRGKMLSVKIMVGIVVVKQCWHSFKVPPSSPDPSVILQGGYGNDFIKKRTPKIKLNSLSIDTSLLDIGVSFGSSKGKVARALVSLKI